MSYHKLDRHLRDSGYALVRCNNHRIYRNAFGQTVVVSSTPNNPSKTLTYVTADIRRNQRRA